MVAKLSRSSFWSDAAGKQPGPGSRRPFFTNNSFHS
jgi:hypothetical protein